MPSRQTSSRPSVCGLPTLLVSCIQPHVPLNRFASVLTAILVAWRVLDLALSLYGKVIVPLYENFGPDSIGASLPSSHAHFQPTTRNRLKNTCRFLVGLAPPTRTQSDFKRISINHSDLSIIFAQPHHVSTLLSLSPKLPTLKTIITLGEVSEPAHTIADAWGRERGIRILTLSEGESVHGPLSRLGSHGFWLSRGDRGKSTFATSVRSGGYNFNYLLYIRKQLSHQPFPVTLRNAI